MSWDIFWFPDDLGPMTFYKIDLSVAQRSSPGLSLSEDGALSAWRRKKVLDLVSHTVAGLVWNKVGWWMDCLLVPVHLPTPNERNGMDAKKQRKTNKKWNKVGWWTPNERIGCEKQTNIKWNKLGWWIASLWRRYTCPSILFHLISLRELKQKQPRLRKYSPGIEAKRYYMAIWV